MLVQEQFFVILGPMANEQTPSPSTPGEESPDVVLQQVDKILDEEDPSFSASLEDVKQAAPEADVVIESIPVAEPDAESPTSELSRDQSLLQNLSSMRPMELIKYLLSLLIGGLKKSALLFTVFKDWSWAQRFGFLFFLAILGASGSLMVMNLKGRWMPQIDKPIHDDMAEVVDKTYSTAEVSWVPLYDALRQPGHRYLFDRFVVNLTRTGRDLSDNPMGLFEFFVELDSNKAAVEVKTRDHELRDLLQRTIEGETYESLSGEPGKEKLKNLIRSEINQLLQEGNVEGVFISKLILKP